MTRMLCRFVSVLLLLILIFLAWRYASPFSSFKNLFKPKPVVVDDALLVVTEIKNIAQLMTVEAYNEVVIDSTRYPFGVPPSVFNAIPGNPLGLLGSSQLVLIVRGKVIAGVDLKAFGQNNIRLKNDSLFVQLPSATVLDIITNPSDVETFMERGTWNEAAATTLKIKARNKLVQQALTQGILQQADGKARNIVYGFLKNLGYKTVTVTTAVQLNRNVGN